MFDLKLSFVIFLAVSCALAQESPEKIYEEFNKKDIECIMNDRKCSKSLSRIKATILKAFEDGCTECTDDDKEAAGRAMAIMLFKQPKIWKLFVSKYDTNDRYKKLHLYNNP